MKLLLLVFIVCSFSMCSTESQKVHTKSQELEKMVFTDSSHANSKIRGAWQSVGNGYLLEVREDSILLYSYTKSYCYKELNDYLEGLLNFQSTYTLHGDTMSVYLTDYAAGTSLLQTKKDFIRISSIPENCMTFSEMKGMSYDNQLKLYQETIMENFAFQERRNLDWADIFSVFADSSIVDEESLFQSLGHIATLTKDQHTKVISMEGQSLQYRVTPSALDVEEAFNEQSEVATLNEYFGLFFNSSYTNISDSLLSGRGQKILNDQIEWGELNDNIGYINIHSFAGFLGREFSRKQQIDSIKAHMTNIISSFQDKDAIVVDVSFNFGGYDASCLTIAGYFTEEPVTAFYSEVYNNGTFHREDEVIIYPASVTFDKPVYVLMTDVSRSAAESFAMMMKALPNAQLAGMNTLGTLSGMLGKSVGTFYTTFSNQRLVDENGIYFEKNGVQPDIPIDVFTKKDVFKGHLNATRQLMEVIESQ